MTANVRKTTIVVSETVAHEWLVALGERDVNVLSSRIVVYEDGATPEEIEQLIAAAGGVS